MIEQGEIRKTISYTYDGEIVHGKHITVSAQNPANDEPIEEKKDSDNDGTFALAYPMDYAGDVYIEVHGSSGGNDNGTLAVE